MPLPRKPSWSHHGRRRPVSTIGPQSMGGVSQDFSIRWIAFLDYQAPEPC